MENEIAVESALALLTAPRSPKRRAGAKRLRRLQDPSAGPAVLAALQKEVQDRRTWETQYQMIMALGACAYTPALPFLWALTQQHFDATMVYLALGDAIVRLERAYPDDPTPVLKVLATADDMLIAGATQAVAVLRLTLTPTVVDQLVASAEGLPTWHPLRGMIARAAAGWSGPRVEAFLRTCTVGPLDYVHQAALAAQQKKYTKWQPS